MDSLLSGAAILLPDIILPYLTTLEKKFKKYVIPFSTICAILMFGYAQYPVTMKISIPRDGVE